MLITVEATGAWSLIIPVTIGVFFAELAADRLSTGVFDGYLHLACMPVLADPGATPGVAHACDRLEVTDVMATGLHALPPVIPVADAVAALTETTFSVRPRPCWAPCHLGLGCMALFTHSRPVPRAASADAS